jgi:hypothetical protein
MTNDDSAITHDDGPVTIVDVIAVVAHTPTRLQRRRGFDAPWIHHLSIANDEGPMTNE